VGDEHKSALHVKPPGGEPQSVSLLADAEVVMQVKWIEHQRLLNKESSDWLKRPWGLLRAMASGSNREATNGVVAKPIEPDKDGPLGRAAKWVLELPFVAAGGEARTARIGLEFGRAVARPGGE
jgi:hypothetical protein